MKNVVEILTELGFELDEEKAKLVDEAVRENYKTRAEFDQKMGKMAEAQKRIEELEGEIAKRDEAIQGMSGTAEELEAYKQQVADYQKREAEAKAKAEEDARREKFRVMFDEALGDRKFSNEIMAEAIFDKAYNGVANADVNACKAYVDSLTANLDGVWTNPQTDPNKMPVPNAGEEKPAEASKFKRFF